MQNNISKTDCFTFNFPDDAGCNPVKLVTDARLFQVYPYISNMRAPINKIFVRLFHFGLKITSRILPQWTRTKHYKTVLPPKTVGLALPVNFSEFPKNFAVFFPAHFDIRERRIFFIKNGNVLGAGVVFKNLRVFIPSVAWLNDVNAFRLGHLLVKQWSDKKNKQNNPVAVVFDLWASVNYYHWMIDTLPRIILLKENYRDCTVLGPERMPEYVTTTMKIFGIEKIIQLPAYEKLSADTIIFPERPAPIGLQDPALIQKGRNLLLNYFLVEPKKTGRLVYISRAKQKVRHLINEAAFLEVMKKYGFETIFFEGMTLKEQAELMAQVSVAIGVNGSNLVNILFMPPDSAVIELMNEKVNNTCTYSLASCVSVAYYAIACNASSPVHSSIDYVEANNADITVDIGQLEKTIRAALDKYK